MRLRRYAAGARFDGREAACTACDRDIQAGHHAADRDHSDRAGAEADQLADAAAAPRADPADGVGSDAVSGAPTAADRHRPATCPHRRTANVSAAEAAPSGHDTDAAAATDAAGPDAAVREV